MKAVLKREIKMRPETKYCIKESFVISKENLHLQDEEIVHKLLKNINKLEEKPCIFCGQTISDSIQPSKNLKDSNVLFLSL